MTAVRVLVVDDSVDCTEMYGVLLDLLGHEHREANSGPEALTLAATFRPDLVLLDVAMPGMTGVEVARALRVAYGREQHVVAVSGHARAPGPDFDERVMKPMDVETLRRLLAEAELRALAGRSS